MKTKILAVFTAIAILICVAVPCLAVEIDFNDYISNESVSGDNTTITVSIPLDELSVQWRLWNRTTGTWPLLKDYTGLSFTHTYSQSIDYALTINPFLNDTIDIRDIPDGTVIMFSYTASGVGYTGDSGLPARVGLTYFDADGKSLGYVNGAFYSGQFLEDNAVPFTIDKPDGAVSVRPSLTFDDFKPIGNVTATISLTGVSFQFSIDSLLRLQQETGRTNKILSQIEDKLDGITDYQPDPTIPGGGIGEDLDNAEDQLMDGSQQGLQDFTTYTQDFLAWLTGSASAFVAAGTLLGVILDVQMYNDLLYASLILGSFALFLGAAITLFKRRE